jgi:hypothetical protein
METFCTGYILGVYDGMSAGNAICPTYGATGYQAINVARKYLREHPELWSKAPSYLLGQAFKSTFPATAKPLRSE